MQAPFSVAGGTCTSGQSLGVEESCTLEVRFSPQTVGVFDDTLKVGYTWQYAGGRQLSEARPIAGSSLPAVTLTRTGSLAPSVPGGSVVVEMVTITNAGSDVATLGAISDAALGLAPAFSSDHRRRCAWSDKPGDSVGGGLALSLLVRLRELGEALPAGAILLPRWTDLSASGASVRTNRRKGARAPRAMGEALRR